MENFTLYLDEANITPTNPYFCLGGMIIKRNVYEDEMIPKINHLKEKHFGTTSVIFHYTDMKKNRDSFSILQDGEKRTNFWQDFNNTLKDIEFTTIGTYIEMNAFKRTYAMKNNKHYEIAFTRLINNYILFLKRNNSLGNIVFESRQWNENAEIQSVFQHILNFGTEFFSSDDCQKYLSTIGFITKKDNCVGLQIADFVPDSYIRKLQNKNNYHNVGVNFLNKIFKINGKYEDIVGIVSIL